MTAQVIVGQELGAGFGSIHAETMADPAAQALAESAANYVHEIDRSAPAVCIDGRCLCDGETPLELGAHIAGGAMTLMIAAEATGYHLKGAELLQAASDKGFNLSAHYDSGNNENGFANGTGCGANDKVPAIGTIFAENKDAIAGVTASLLKSRFDDSIMSNLTLPTPAETDWKKTFLIETIGKEKSENLLDDGTGVHGHNEQMVVFNEVPNTSFDRDAFVRETGKQVFFVDLWYIKELALAMATGSNAEERAKQLEHAMVSYQVATYLALCDGSHRPATIQNEEFADAS